MVVVSSAVVGVVLIAGALQGYLIGVGDLTRHPILAWPIRLLIMAGGLLMAVPGGGLIPYSDGELWLFAVATTGPALIAALWANRREEQIAES